MYEIKISLANNWCRIDRYHPKDLDLPTVMVVAQYLVILDTGIVELDWTYLGSGAWLVWGRKQCQALVEVNEYNRDLSYGVDYYA